MKSNQLKELIRQIVREENDYQKLFKTMLDKTGKSITSMSDTEKKAFFNAVDKAAKAKSEGKLRGYNESEGGYTADTSGMESDVDGQVSSEFSKALSSVAELKLKESRKSDILIQIEKLRVAANSGKITGAQFQDRFYPLWKELKTLKEGDLPGNQEKLDTDKDGEIEGSDLAALRAKNEGAQKKK